MQATPKSPGLEAHQNALKVIYSWTTDSQFDTAPTLLKEKRFEILKPTQIATLLWVVENQRKLYASKSTPITVEEVSSIESAPKLSWEVSSPAKAMAEEYKEVDEEQFGAEEVSLASAVTEVESVMPESVLPTNNILGDDSRPPDMEGNFTPASETVDTPKRSRKAKVGWLDPMPVPTQWVQSVTVSRRVNLPIEWVQYSNNEFNVSVTASNREDAVNELNELTTSFLADQWLVRKSIADKTIADLRAQLKAEQEAKIAKTVAPAWDPELVKKHEKLREMMNYIYKNSTNKAEFVALKESFTSLPN